MLVDGGFVTLADIDALEQRGCRVHAPVMHRPRPARARDRRRHRRDTPATMRWRRAGCKRRARSASTSSAPPLRSASMRLRATRDSKSCGSADARKRRRSCSGMCWRATPSERRLFAPRPREQKGRRRPGDSPTTSRKERMGNGDGSNSRSLPLRPPFDHGLATRSCLLTSEPRSVGPLRICFKVS